MREVEDKHWWFSARRKIVKRVLKSLDQPEGVNVLDVGCGTGGNFKMLAEFGNVEGLECEKSAIAMAEARRACLVHHGCLPESVSLEKGKYNLITLFDVLEHIENDLGALQVVSGLLAADGRLMITVPAFPFLWGEHDISHHHKRRYRKVQLEELLRRSGMEVEYLTYYNCFLFPLVVAARFIKKVFGVQGDEERLPLPLINRMLEYIMGSERFLMPYFKYPFGVSLLAVCRKSGHLNDM